MNKIKKITIEFEEGDVFESPIYGGFNGFSSDIDPCSGCSNHPANGGSGMCHCTIPYMTGKYYNTIML